MSLKNLKVGLINFLKRPKEAVSDLVAKFKAQKLRVPQIRLENLAGPLGTLATQRGRETFIQGARHLRGAGQTVSGFGQRLAPSPTQLRVQPPFVSLARQSLARPLQVGGEVIRGLGASAERLLKPAETLKVLRESPTTRGLDIFGTFEQPTKVGIATDILGAGFDVTDIGKAGLIGVFGAGVRETPGQVSKVVQRTSVLDDVQKGFKTAREARGPAKFGIAIDKARRDLLDRLTPVFDLVQKGAKNLPTEQNPYKRMRIIAGIGGKIQATLDKGLAPVLQKEVNRLDDLSSLLVFERSQELADRGVKTRYSLEQVGEGLDELKQKYGDEGFRTLQDSGQQIRNYANSLLDSLKASGIVDEKSYQAIRAKNELYVPFQIVDYITEGVESGRFGRTSFNVASQDVIKGIKGSEKALGDPIEALVERTGKVLSLVERNNALKSLVDLRKADPSIFGELIKPATGPIEKGFDTINLFENGKNVKYVVPQDVATAIKNIDAQTSNILVDILRPQANLLRLGATGLNLPFILSNPVRDFADAMFGEITEKGFRSAARLLASYPAAVASAIKRDDLYQRWALAGGRQATFTSQITGLPRATVEKLAGQETLLQKINPLNLIRFWNGVMEESTRLARFRAGVEAGEELTEAAFRSRDITVDFAKSGNAIKVLNQIVPFLNANIQGVERMFRIFKNNPTRAMVAAGTLAGFPAVLTYLHNRQFEDYRDIPQWEKDLNWIIIARDRTPVEKLEGEPIKGVKIPKGRVAGIPASITEAFLQFVDQNEPQSLADLARRTIENISPIGFPIGKEGFLRTASTITPPLLKAGIEAGTNTSFFTGLPIVPERLKGVEPIEQYRETTPSAYRTLGKLGISPLKAEQFVRTATGGLGQTIAETASLESPLKGIARRFTEIRSGAEVDKMFDEVEKYSRASKTKTLKEQREAEKIYTEIKGLQGRARTQRIVEVARNNPKLYERVVELGENERLGLTAIDRSIRALPVKDGSRARFIFEQANRLDTQEERSALYKDYAAKKILTKDVSQQLQILFSRQKQRVQQELEKEKTSFVRERPGGISEGQTSLIFDAIVETLAKANPFNPPEVSATEFADILPSETIEITKEGTQIKKVPPKISLGKYIQEKYNELKKSVKEFFKSEDTYTITKDELKVEPTTAPTPTPTEVPAKELRVYPTPTPPKTKWDNTIAETFGKEADNARKVLKRRNQDGSTVGENTTLDPSLDFGGNADKSRDRGLFQINENTFNWLMNSPHRIKVEKAEVRSFDDLFDPIKNIKVAKIIFDIAGWDWWIAAPAYLLSRKEIERRKREGIQVIP